jgi:hypothetical protein
MDTLDERLRRAGVLVSPPEPALDRLARRRERRHRSRRIASAMVALVVAAAGIGAVVVSMAALAGRETVQTPSAPPGAQPPPPLGAGEYFYERTTRFLPQAYGLGGGRVDEETWWGRDGSGRRVADSTTPDYGLGPIGTWDRGEMQVEDLSGLSTDPAVLAEQLRRRSAPGGASPQPPGTPEPGIGEDSASLWRAIGHLLEMPNAEPALRAALFEVAAGIPEVDVRRDVEDPVGRRAIALSMSVGDGDLTMFFDPNTLQPLASVEDYGGDAVWYRIVESAGIVESTQDEAHGPQLLVPPPPGPLPVRNQ